MSDPQRPHGLQHSRLIHPWDFPGKSTGVGCHCLLRHFDSRSYIILEAKKSTKKYIGHGQWLVILKSHKNNHREVTRVDSLSWTKVRRRRRHPLQCSRLENPMDGGAWNAAVHGVAEGRTRLSDFTFTFHFHFSLSCIGEGNGNPLQCPCLENPRDWGAWWAAVHGVAQSRTQLKRLSSSSSRQK